MSGTSCQEREPIGELRPIVTADPCGINGIEATNPLGSRAQVPTPTTITITGGKATT